MDDVADDMLLQQYAREGSQRAFSELASRHAGWVYTTAVRVLRDRHLAEDVTQAVFLVLAERAGELTGKSLGPWLFRVTRYSCARALRAKSRRERHEREAGAMMDRFSEPGEGEAWERVEPLLDELVGRLAPAAREAILLRFYQQKNLAEVGRCLGVSEEAARKRVGKAVQELRGMFRKRGVVVPAGVLAGVMAAGMSTEAPAGVVAACGAAAAGKAAGSASVIAKGAVVMMVGQKVKVAALGVVLALIPAGAGYVAWSRASSSTAGRRDAAGASGGAIAVARPVPVAAPATQPSEEAERRRIVHEIVVCQGHLHAIGQGLLHWAERHGGKYPPDLGTLIRDKAAGFSIGMFACPGTGTKPPGNLTRDQQADWVNAHSDYVYVGDGLNSQGTDPDHILAYETKGHHPMDRATGKSFEGINILNGRRTAVFVRIDQAEKQIEQEAKARKSAATRP